MGVFVTPVKMKFSQLREMDWMVGLKRETKISQSFSFIVDLPKMRNEDLEHLTKEREVDSWILRLIVNRGPRQIDLGSIYVPFYPKNHTRGTQQRASSISIRIMYASAYASERFRKFKCPVMGHNRRIMKKSIDGEDKDFSIYIAQSVPYPDKPQLIDIRPSEFNGGHQLKGDYHVEIAAYNSRKKILHSPFVRLPQYVNISSEEMIGIKSCDGHKEIKSSF
jgi:hypothetical protein